jgi:DNA-binding response OmpR family regulator
MRLSLSTFGHRRPLVVGPVVLDRAACRALVSGQLVHLPAQEAALLEVLMSHPGRVLSAAELLATHDAKTAARLDTLVRRLSSRLAVIPLPQPLIERVGIAGYRFTVLDG